MLSKSDVVGAVRDLQSLHASLTGYKGKTETAFGAVASQGLSFGSAFLYGVAEGAMGPIKVGPLNADFLGAILVHGAAFFGYAGRYQDSAHSIAQGLLDGFGGRLGIGVGTGLGLKKGHAALSVTDPRGSFRVGAAASELPKRGPVTQAEIVALIERAR